MIFIDTDIAIAFRDGDQATRDLVLALNVKPVLAMITRIELEAGVYRSLPGDVALRRAAVDRLLRAFAVVGFTEADVRAYGAIVAQQGHARGQTLDRLIAAQAITRNATLITRNGKDFRRIEGLRLEIWPPMPDRA